MNVPTPAPPAPIVVNTLPTVTATTTASGISAVLGYGALWLAGKYQIPAEVVGGVLGLVFTGLTSLWHRIMPPGPMP
jgi:hypothetical protein